MLNDNRLYSIIIPAYNAQETLVRCVDSVLAQSYSNFELIIVNDGSKDNTARIIDEYAAKDSRVIPIHKLNGGVSSARNVGLDRAKGDYVAFVDADDWLAERFLESFNKSESDVLIEGYKLFNESDEVINTYTPENLIVTGENKTAELLEKYIIELYFRTPWAKCFKRDLLEKFRIKFDLNIKFGEDTVFFLEAIRFSKNIELIEESNYFYYSPINQICKYSFYFKDYFYIVVILSEILKGISDEQKLQNCHNTLRSIYWDTFIMTLLRSPFKQTLIERFLWLRNRMWIFLPSYKGLGKIKQLMKILFFNFYKISLLRNR